MREAFVRHEKPSFSGVPPSLGDIKQAKGKVAEEKIKEVHKVSEKTEKGALAIIHHTIQLLKPKTKMYQMVLID